MTVKTKVITRNNEVDDFLKELLGKVHYIAQSADDVLIKNFSYLSDKLSYYTFNQVDKNAQRIMEALVFENKRMITLFFKPNIYDDTKNDCHNSELSYFCQLKDGVLYIPEKIDAIELKKRYSFSRDIKLFFKKEYKNRCIRSVQIVNNDNFFFKDVNIQPYQYKLYSGEVRVERLSESELSKILGERKFPSLSSDEVANKIYDDIYQLQIADIVCINKDYDYLLMPESVELTYYESYGFLAEGVGITVTQGSGVVFYKTSNLKFQKFGSSLESCSFMSKAELDTVLEEMAICQIKELENSFFPSKQIENKEKFLQLMSELYDRRVEVKKEIFNLFNAEFNETLQQLGAIVDKNKTDNII